MRNIALVLCAMIIVSATAFAGDWPQFQGPDRSGVSGEKGLATSWPEGGPEVLWTQDLNAGFGGPAVQDGKVYVMDRIENKSDVLLCLDLATGKEDWRYSYDAPGKVQYPGPRSTPLVDDKYVYIVGPFGHFNCVDKKSHKAVWSKHILKDFDSNAARWAVSQSPCSYKDMVIVAPQSRTVGVVAFNRDSGKQVWASKAIGSMAYHSPQVTNVHGVDTVIMQSQDAVVGIDAASGDILWSYEGWRCNHPVPSPTYCGDGKFFVTGAYGAGCVMFQVTKTGDTWSVKQLFKLTQNQGLSSWMHNALLHDKHLYGNSTTNRKGLVCMGLDGKIVWQSNDPAKGSEQQFDIGGNLIIADGMIYIMDGKTGTLHLVKADPAGYHELASAKVLDGEMVWAPMALSDGTLLCRDQKQLKCIDVKAPSAAGKPESK